MEVGEILETGNLDVRAAVELELEVSEELAVEVVWGIVIVIVSLETGMRTHAITAETGDLTFFLVLHLCTLLKEGMVET